MCAELVADGYCEKHRRAHHRAIAAQREPGPRMYDRAAWRNDIRPAQLRRHPLCETCTTATPASEVDHRDGNPWNNDPSNLASLCESCHSRKTATHDGGFGNR